MKPELICEIVDRVIMIRLPVDTLAFAASAAGPLADQAFRADANIKVTDPDEFAKEVVRELYQESEDGTTLIHRMFDAAIESAFESGAEGIEWVPDQTGKPA